VRADALIEAAESIEPPAPVAPDLPTGWVPLTLEWEPGYPEDVAYGPQRMMDRLKKWLDKHFATRTAESTAPAPVAQPDSRLRSSSTCCCAGAVRYRCGWCATGADGAARESPPPPHR